MNDRGKMKGRVNPEQQKVLDHPDSLCLSAGAGSGKTRTLVEKYLQLLVEVDRSPSEILAITFTEKAAAEMQFRIRQELQHAVQSETDPDRCRLLEEKLMNLGGGWIFTIHAFGARVLREHPAEAGVDPAFAPFPEQESQILWESAGMSAVMELVERDPVVGELAWRLGLQPTGGASVSLLSVLLSIKSQLEAQGLGPEDIIVRDPPAGRFLDMGRMAALLDQLIHVDEPGPTLLKKMETWKALRLEIANTGMAPAGFLRMLSKAGWDEEGERLMPGGRFRRNEKEIFEQLCDTTRMLALQASEICESDQTGTLLRLLRSMWENATREKARRRALDFSDLEIKTLQLLREHPGVAESYRERFKHILVDEYQDVNAVQANIIRILTGDRPQSLFAVGDPKQSIYRFRGADVEQFQNLWAQMDRRHSAFQLKRNYRSHPRLVCAVNAFFDTRIFCGNPPVEMDPAREIPDIGRISVSGAPSADGSDIGRISVSGAPSADGSDIGRISVSGAPSAGVSDDARPRIQWLSFNPGDVLATRRREVESQILTRHIRQMVEAGSAPPATQVPAAPTTAGWGYGDFVLLFRATSSLHLYEESLRREQVPYELVKSGTAFRSQEVFDLLNALTVAVDSSDKVAWLGFLRSAIAGLSDNALVILARHGDIRDFFLGRPASGTPALGAPEALIRATLPESLNPQDMAAAVRAAEFVEEAAKTERRRRTPLSLIDWVIDRSGYQAILRGLPQSDARLRSVDTLRGLAAQYNSHRPDPHIAFLEAAWRMVERRERETGADALAEDRVKLMTIHQAKGLEFPVVILPDLLRSDPVRHPDFFVVREDGGPALAARVKVSGAAEKFPTTRWRRERERSIQSEADEQKRLLYVAMTRARDLLVLPGPDEHIRGNSVWEMLYDFLKEEPGHVEVVPMEIPEPPAAIAEPRGLRERLLRVNIQPVPFMTIPAGISIRRATSFAPKRDGAERGRAGGRKSGSAFAVSLGTLAHEILQDVDLHANPPRQGAQMKELLDSRLAWTPIPEKLRDQLEKNLRNFFTSKLADRMRINAPRVRREYPFTFLLGRISASGAPSADGSDIGRNAAEEQFVTGKVDVLIFGDAGVEIYDYKYTEATKDFGEYEGQLMAYALAACTAFDLPRATVGLQFLLGNQQLLTMPVDRRSAKDYLLAGTSEAGSL